MPYQLDGDAIPTSRSSSRRAWISTAEGIVARVAGDRVRIEGDSAITLRHSLPSVIDLCPLLGRRVRTTLVHVATCDGVITQTLTFNGAEKPILIAHTGNVRGNAHALGKLTVFVALSQRPGGPMVFGTSRLQSLVRAGDHVRVRDEDDDVYVMHFASRGQGEARYAIAEESLWRGPPSTRRG
jgi:hypothetical protein